MISIIRWLAGSVPQKERGHSTRQLMGIERLTDHGVCTPEGELAFFLVKPDNLSVLSPDGVRARVESLVNLIKGTEAMQIIALDSQESFQRNRDWYRLRMEQETEPKVRELLQKDMGHLDLVQSATISTREFAFIIVLSKEGRDRQSRLLELEKSIQDRRFRVRLAGREDVKRILAAYYRQAAQEQFENFDGERAVTGNG